MIASDKAKRLYKYVTSFSGRGYNDYRSVDLDFSCLVTLLQSIQKRGKIPRLSQIEDLIPLRIYINKLTSCKSFVEYCDEAERIGLVHIEYDSHEKTLLQGNTKRDGNIILLKPLHSLDSNHSYKSIGDSIYSTVKDKLVSLTEFDSKRYTIDEEDDCSRELLAGFAENEGQYFNGYRQIESNASLNATHIKHQMEKYFNQLKLKND